MQSAPGPRIGHGIRMTAAMYIYTLMASTVTFMQLVTPARGSRGLGPLLIWRTSSMTL